MEVEFTKMHGNGNDFIVIDETRNECIADNHKGMFASLMCNRKTGIGADGVIFVKKTNQPTRCDLRFQLFEQDTNEAEFCGNGMRCFAKFAFENGYINNNATVETAAGPVKVTIHESTGKTFKCQIAMPTPQFEPLQIPAIGSTAVLKNGQRLHVVTIDGLTIHAVRVGVPHAVVLVENLHAVAVGEIGKSIRFHETYPEGINVNFVQIEDSENVLIRTFEKGVEAETLSCGSGATAAVVVLNKLALVDSVVNVHSSGGKLKIGLSNETLLMEGPAVTVFTGKVGVSSDSSIFGCCWCSNCI